MSEAKQREPVKIRLRREDETNVLSQNQHTHVCMYVCMYVCIYTLIYIYVIMYPCVYIHSIQTSPHFSHDVFRHDIIQYGSMVSSLKFAHMNIN